MGTDTYAEITEMIQRYAELEHEGTSMVCLEDQVRLEWVFLMYFCTFIIILIYLQHSILPPNTCQFVNLHFMALKSQVHRIQEVEVYDSESGKSSTLYDVLEIYASSWMEVVDCIHCRIGGMNGMICWNYDLVDG